MTKEETEPHNSGNYMSHLLAHYFTITLRVVPSLILNMFIPF